MCWPGRVAAAALLASVLVQGCGVRIGEDEPQQAWDEWNLRDPPTRAEVGIPDGRTTVIYQDSPDSVRTVTVRLPEPRPHVAGKLGVVQHARQQ